jgi:hypothetical protein
MEVPLGSCSGPSDAGAEIGPVDGQESGAEPEFATACSVMAWYSACGSDALVTPRKSASITRSQSESGQSTAIFERVSNVLRREDISPNASGLALLLFEESLFGIKSS